jgi:hypothetical protein
MSLKQLEFENSLKEEILKLSIFIPEIKTKISLGWDTPKIKKFFGLSRYQDKKLCFVLNHLLVNLIKEYKKRTTLEEQIISNTIEIRAKLLLGWPKNKIKTFLKLYRKPELLSHLNFLFVEKDLKETQTLYCKEIVFYTAEIQTKLLLGWPKSRIKTFLGLYKKKNIYKCLSHLF